MSAVANPAAGFPSSLSWQAYPLANGWQTYAAASGDTSYADPQYAILGAIVFLRGVLGGAAAVGALGALPAAARPAKKERLIVCTPGGAPTVADMNATGVILTPAGGTFAGETFLVINGWYSIG